MRVIAVLGDSRASPVHCPYARTGRCVFLFGKQQASGSGCFACGRERRKCGFLLNSRWRVLRPWRLSSPVDSLCSVRNRSIGRFLLGRSRIGWASACCAAWAGSTSSQAPSRQCCFWLEPPSSGSTPIRQPTPARLRGAAELAISFLPPIPAMLRGAAKLAISFPSQIPAMLRGDSLFRRSRPLCCSSFVLKTTP